MHTTIAALVGGTEIMVIAIAALVLFGARKIPEFAKGLGQAMKEFKKASNEEDPPAAPPSAPATPASK